MQLFDNNDNDGVARFVFQSLALITLVELGTLFINPSSFMFQENAFCSKKVQQHKLPADSTSFIRQGKDYILR